MTLSEAGSGRMLEELRREIIQETLRPGDLMPPADSLADQFRVTVSQVRKTLSLLADLHLVTDPGQGEPVRVLKPMNQLPELMSPYLFDKDGDTERRLLRDATEMRVAVMWYVAELAAANADIEAIEDLEIAVLHMETASPGQERQEAEQPFFEALCAATKNRAVVLFGYAMTTVSTMNQDVWLHMYTGQFNIHAHRDCVAAIKAADATAAGRVMINYGQDGWNAVARHLDSSTGGLRAQRRTPNQTPTLADFPAGPNSSQSIHQAISEVESDRTSSQFRNLAYTWLIDTNGLPDPRMAIDILSIRVAMQWYAAEQAARHATTDQVLQVAVCVEALDAAQTAEEVQLADWNFLLALIQATGNTAFQLIIEFVGSMYEDLKGIMALCYHGPFTSEPHHTTLHAIADRQPSIASTAMTTHAQQGWQNMKKAFHEMSP